MTDDVLAGLAADPTPRVVEDRLLIAEAINTVADAHNDLVHASTLRPLIPSTVSPRYIGVTVHTLASRGVLKATGTYAPNGGGGKARNKSKHSPIWRRVRPILPEDVS